MWKFLSNLKINWVLIWIANKESIKPYDFERHVVLRWSYNLNYKLPQWGEKIHHNGFHVIASTALGPPTNRITSYRWPVVAIPPPSPKINQRRSKRRMIRRIRTQSGISFNSHISICGRKTSSSIRNLQRRRKRLKNWK